MIDPLRDYKINAVQYYDWMDEHHVLYRDGHEFWQDIAARDPWVSRAKLNELIARGHGYNMAAMAYDLMYGAYDDYLAESDVSLAWGAFTRPLDGVPYTLADQDRHELNIAEWETQRAVCVQSAVARLARLDGAAVAERVRRHRVRRLAH